MIIKQNEIKIKKINGLTAALLSLIAALTNFIIQHWTSVIFKESSGAVGFLIVYSVALISSGFLSTALSFRDFKTQTIIIDLGFIITIIAFFVIVTISYKELSLLIIGLGCLFLLRDIYKFRGSLGSFWLFNLKLNQIISLALCFAVISLVSLKYHNSLQNHFLFWLLVVSSSLFFISFSLNQNNIYIYKWFYKPFEYIQILFAEILPLIAGYLITVKSASSMNNIEYLKFRSEYAFVGVASVIGSLSLGYFARNRTNFSIFFNVAGLSAIIIVLSAVIYCHIKYLLILLLIIATSLAMISMSIFRTGLSKKHYLMSSLFAPTAAIIFFACKHNPSAEQIILMIIIVNSIQTLISKVLYNKKTV